MTGENFDKCTAQRLLFELDISEALWIIATFKHIELL